MVTILEAIREGQRAVARGEAVATQRLIGAYERVEWRIVEELRRLDRDIAAVLARGGTVPPDWLADQTWYRQLQASIDVELARFTDDAARTLASTQASSLQAARESARLFDLAIGSPFEGRVNAPAFERWVSATRPGSPLREVLATYGTRASSAIEAAITEGIGAGQGVNAIVRDVQARIGTDVVEWRLRTLSRTEALRAYRGGFADTMAPYEEQGIITGYERIAAKSTRTCIACLGADGTITTHYPEDFHPADRCVARPVVRPGLVPGGRPRETGAAWFATQDEDVQRAMFPTAAHEQAYRAGVPLSAMVGTRRNATWGDSITVLPASRIARKGAA